MTGIASVYVTFADEAEARRIGRTIVEEGRAACVNIIGQCHSIYRWEGKVEEAGEVAAIFKVAADNVALLIRRIGELHSYQVPAATVWPIEEASENYRHWVKENSGR